MRENRFLATPDSAVLLFQRLVLGCVMFPHGAQKVLGWFGGPGWHGALGYMQKGIGLSSVLAALVILGEFLGSIALVLGLFTRLGAFCITVVMIGAIATTHWHHGFFMNWMGTKPGEGFEYHLLALGLALPLLAKGGGMFSIDRAITHGDAPSTVTP
jgi:putative oxidoreductase